MVYIDISSQSLSWASLGLFHTGTILGQAQDLRWAPLYLSLGFPYSLQIPGHPFPCSLAKKSGFSPGLAFRVKWQEREENGIFG